MHGIDCTLKVLMIGLQCTWGDCTLLMIGLQFTTVIVRYWWLGYNASTVRWLYVIDDLVTMHDSDCASLMIGLQCTTVIVRSLLMIGLRFATVIVRYWWLGYNARQWLYVKGTDGWVTMHDSDCTLSIIGLQCTSMVVRYWWLGSNSRQWLYVIDDWVTMHDSDCTLHLLNYEPHYEEVAHSESS